ASYPGSGLGLAITRAIVEGHQGKVSVESSPQGTCFSLQLPV
ncbi:MAG: two-component sensor histidine kinase, partial [Anaerolineae bacterium]|nr:two-component sensor histidine kinase [Anaerolineae bacterium]